MFRAPPADGRSAAVGVALDDVEAYFHGVARARYVIRRIFRLVDEQVRRHGLDPLQHQALVQIFGSGGRPLRINDVAERLDIAPAFASRLARDLETRGLINRRPSTEDKRITLVTATDVGRELLVEIDQQVQLHIAYFASQLSTEDRAAAMSTFGLYVGVPPERDDIMSLTRVMQTIATRGTPTPG